MNTKDGGAAFPKPDTERYGGNDGMTLRDYFAAKAMQGMASAPDNWNHSDIPELAYKLADAMIAEREERK